jgi:hypothetical protein
MLALGVALALVIPGSGLTELEIADALKGEVPTRTEAFTSPKGKSSGRGVGAIVVDAAIADVWAVVSHYDDKADYMPRVDKVEILARTPSLMKIRMTVDATVTTARYTAFFQIDESQHRIHWVLDASARDNTIAGCDGEYLLFPLAPNRTLLVYRTWVDSGLAVPRFIQDHMAKKSIPELLHALQKRILTHGQYRKK